AGAKVYGRLKEVAKDYQTQKKK
ncbi:MAG: hypothetical protein RLZZ181_877, partial [Pseudomonadota bacterium]